MIMAAAGRAVPMLAPATAAMMTANFKIVFLVIMVGSPLEVYVCLVAALC